MRTSLSLAVLLVAGLATATPLMAQTMASGTQAVSDATFVKKAAVSGMYEVQAAQLAQTKATSADVKSFASRMITDHTKANDQLKTIVASKSGLKIPTALDAAHRALMAKLKAASGAAFDKTYVQQQVDAHQKAVMLFTAESNNGKDTDLKQFATQTLPTLQQHLTMAQNLQKGGATP